MTVEEQQRRVLQEALVNTIGPEPADALMHYLPPVGWADVATKHDLDILRYEFKAELHQELRSQTYHLMGFFIGMQAVMIAALKFI